MPRLAAAVAAGEPVPEVVLVCAGLGDEDEAGAAERAAGRVLAVIQEFLAAAALADAPLVIVTRGAASVRPGGRGGPSVRRSRSGAVRPSRRTLAVCCWPTYLRMMPSPSAKAW